MSDLAADQLERLRLRNRAKGAHTIKLIEFLLKQEVLLREHLRATQK